MKPLQVKPISKIQNGNPITLQYPGVEQSSKEYQCIKRHLLSKELIMPGAQKSPKSLQRSLRSLAIYKNYTKIHKILLMPNKSVTSS